MSNLSDYLDHIWGDTDAYACIAIIDENKVMKRVFPKWPEQKDAAESFILGKSAQGNEVYVTPALWKGKVPTGSSYKEYFQQSNVLWADLDGNAPETWPPVITRPDGERSSTDVSAPSMRVQSSTPDRQHLYLDLILMGCIDLLNVLLLRILELGINDNLILVWRYQVKERKLLHKVVMRIHLLDGIILLENSKDKFSITSLMLQALLIA